MAEDLRVAKEKFRHRFNFNRERQNLGEFHDDWVLDERRPDRHKTD